MTIRCLPALCRVGLASWLLAAWGLALGASLGPLETVRDGTEKVLAILSDPALKAPEKKELRRKTVLDAVDSCFNWPDISQRSLGIHWQKRSAAERTEFTAVYTELIRDTYLTKIGNYSGEKVLYDGEKMDGNYARAMVRIVTKQNTDIPVTYSLKKMGDRWLIYDMAVEGVSLVNNYRTQFSSMLDGKTYPEFLKELQAKVDRLKKL
jgi:phospholipid transport system substrate-binding protein